MILQIIQKYSVTFIKINSWKDGGDVITGLDSGRRECLALNFRHVSFVQVRKNNRCQADIHVYTLYINNQTRFHLNIFSTSSKLHMQFHLLPLISPLERKFRVYEAILFVDSSLLQIFFSFNYYYSYMNTYLETEHYPCMIVRMSSFFDSSIKFLLALQYKSCFPFMIRFHCYPVLLDLTVLQFNNE